MSHRSFAKLPPPPAWHNEITTVGVTGTNGKTSTTLLVGAALATLTSPVAQVTSVGSFLDREPFETSRDYAGFLATLAAGRRRGGRLAAIELTSEALAHGFAKAWPCRVAVFTNLTRDHLDAHGTAEHYLASKAQLFMQLPEEGVAVLNASDPAAALLAEVVPAHARIWRYSVPSRGDVDGADLSAVDVCVGWHGTKVVLDGIDAPREVHVAAIGEVFVENTLAALGAAMAMGIDVHVAARAMAHTPPPPGRFEVVSQRPHVVVDYAHTPDALRRTLGTARSLCDGNLTVVLGAGGDRDELKRPLIGEAAMAADRIVLTSDNSRGEDPDHIVAQIRAGIDGGDVVVELDRRAAIREAVLAAGARDVVVIAGRGHEVLQEQRGQEIRFCDAEVARQAFRDRGPSPRS